MHRKQTTPSSRTTPSTGGTPTRNDSPLQLRHELLRVSTVPFEGVNPPSPGDLGLSVPTPTDQPTVFPRLGSVDDRNGSGAWRPRSAQPQPSSAVRSPNTSRDEDTVMGSAAYLTRPPPPPVGAVPTTNNLFVSHGSSDAVRRSPLRRYSPTAGEMIERGAASNAYPDSFQPVMHHSSHPPGLGLPSAASPPPPPPSGGTASTSPLVLRMTPSGVPPEYYQWHGVEVTSPNSSFASSVPGSPNESAPNDGVTRSSGNVAGAAAATRLLNTNSTSNLPTVGSAQQMAHFLHSGPSQYTPVFVNSAVGVLNAPNAAGSTAGSTVVSGGIGGAERPSSLASPSAAAPGGGGGGRLGHGHRSGGTASGGGPAGAGASGGVTVVTPTGNVHRTTSQLLHQMAGGLHGRAYAAMTRLSSEGNVASGGGRVKATPPPRSAPGSGTGRRVDVFPRLSSADRVLAERSGGRGSGDEERGEHATTGTVAAEATAFHVQHGAHLSDQLPVTEGNGAAALAAAGVHTSSSSTGTSPTSLQQQLPRPLMGDAMCTDPSSRVGGGASSHSSSEAASPVNATTGTSCASRGSTTSESDEGWVRAVRRFTLVGRDSSGRDEASLHSPSPQGTNAQSPVAGKEGIVGGRVSDTEAPSWLIEPHTSPTSATGDGATAMTTASAAGASAARAASQQPNSANPAGGNEAEGGPRSSVGDAAGTMQTAADAAAGEAPVLNANTNGGTEGPAPHPLAGLTSGMQLFTPLPVSTNTTAAPTPISSPRSTSHQLPQQQQQPSSSQPPTSSGFTATSTARNVTTSMTTAAGGLPSAHTMSPPARPSPTTRTNSVPWSVTDTKGGGPFSSGRTASAGSPPPPQTSGPTSASYSAGTSHFGAASFSHTASEFRSTMGVNSRPSLLSGGLGGTSSGMSFAFPGMMNANSNASFALNNNASFTFAGNASFANMSFMKDPLAASMMMQQSRTALIAELERRREKLKKQLALLQREATAHNIFALVRTSNASQLQYLLQQNLCNVNERDYNGCTALHVAASEGNQAIVRVLLSFGADVLAVDNLGRTPLDCAAANRHSGVGRYLLNVIRNRQQQILAQSGVISENERPNASDLSFTAGTAWAGLGAPAALWSPRSGSTVPGVARSDGLGDDSSVGEGTPQAMYGQPRLLGHATPPPLSTEETAMLPSSMRAARETTQSGDQSSTGRNTPTDQAGTAPGSPEQHATLSTPPPEPFAQPSTHPPLASSEHTIAGVLPTHLYSVGGSPNFSVWSTSGAAVDGSVPRESAGVDGGGTPQVAGSGAAPATSKGMPHGSGLAPPASLDATTGVVPLRHAGDVVGHSVSSSASEHPHQQLLNSPPHTLKTTENSVSTLADAAGQPMVAIPAYLGGPGGSGLGTPSSMPSSTETPHRLSAGIDSAVPLTTTATGTGARLRTNFNDYGSYPDGAVVRGAEPAPQTTGPTGAPVGLLQPGKTAAQVTKPATLSEEHQPKGLHFKPLQHVVPPAAGATKADSAGAPALSSPLGDDRYGTAHRESLHPSQTESFTDVGMQTMEDLRQEVLQTRRPMAPALHPVHTHQPALLKPGVVAGAAAAGPSASTAVAAGPTVSPTTAGGAGYPWCNACGSAHDPLGPCAGSPLRASKVVSTDASATTGGGGGGGGAANDTKGRHWTAGASKGSAVPFNTTTVQQPPLLPPAPQGPLSAAPHFISREGNGGEEEEAATTAAEGEGAVDKIVDDVPDLDPPYSSYTTVSDTISLIVCMVGLPGRGKSFISKRLVRYMNWKGVPCRVFNAGNYRRKLLGVEGTAGADFFNPDNPEGKELRERMAELACEDLVRFIGSHPLAIGILDATNTTSMRRRRLKEFFSREAGAQGVPYRLLFIESVCTDETIITENILRSKCDNDDFRNVKDTNTVIAEFRERIQQYERVYETLEPTEGLPFIKIINVKHHVIIHNVSTGLGSRIAFFLLNLHPVAYPIYIALPGETEGDRLHVFGGDERLTVRGSAYAVALKHFIQDRYVPNMVVLHATNRCVLSTLRPLLEGDDDPLPPQPNVSPVSGNLDHPLAFPHTTAVHDDSGATASTGVVEAEGRKNAGGEHQPAAHTHHHVSHYNPIVTNAPATVVKVALSDGTTVAEPAVTMVRVALPEGPVAAVPEHELRKIHTDRSDEVHLRAMAGGDMQYIPHRSPTSEHHPHQDPNHGQPSPSTESADGEKVNSLGEADHDDARVTSEEDDDDDIASEEEDGDIAEEVLCPVPGLDNINYGRFSGHTAKWVKEKYPRLSSLLYVATSEESATSSGKASGAPSANPSPTTKSEARPASTDADLAKGGANTPATTPTAAVDGASAAAVHTASGDAVVKERPPLLSPSPAHGSWRGAAPLPPPTHYSKIADAVQALQHKPSGRDPLLSYCVQFPNGESCRQVNVRLEPALMAVMRTQSPVFVIAPSVPAQGMLAFFADIIPELAPTLRVPANCVVEMGIKDDVTVHPLLPDAGVSSPPPSSTPVIDPDEIEQVLRLANSFIAPPSQPVPFF